MNYIIDILEYNASRINPSGTISKIVDNADNTYTITTNKISELLLNNHVVTIIDTPEFNGDYIVSNIDYSALTFDISLDLGKTITTLGTWSSEVPYFYVDYVEGYAETMSQQNLVKIIEKKNFPNIYIKLPIGESGSERETSVEITPFTMYFVNSTIYEQNTKYRLEYRMPYLRKIYEAYIGALLSDKRLVGSFDKNYKEFPMFEVNKGSMINSVIDVIEVSYTDINLIKQSCN
jgi:hypothetical protein